MSSRNAPSFESISTDFETPHEAILSRLEYWQYKDGNIHFYPKEEFEKSVSTFNDINIIYAKRHPATGFKGRSLNDVLKETDGKIVGKTHRATINNMGSPKLSAILKITDPEIDEKIKAGQVSISPGFWYTAPKVGSLKNVSGDHVLLFDRGLGIPQGDVAAMIVNQSTDNENATKSNGNNGTETAYYGFTNGYLPSETGETMTENKSELDTIAAILKTNQDELNGKIIEREKDILKLNQDIEIKESAILKLNQEIEIKNAKIGELETQIKNVEEERLKNQQDTFWNKLLPGTQEKFTDRRTELKDPAKAGQLYTDIFDYEKSVPSASPQSATGDPNLINNQGTEDDQTETLSALRTIKQIVGR